MNIICLTWTFGENYLHSLKLNPNVSEIRGYSQIHSCQTHSILSMIVIYVNHLPSNLHQNIYLDQNNNSNEANEDGNNQINEDDSKSDDNAINKPGKG